MNALSREAGKIARELLNNQIGLFFDRNMLFSLDGYPTTTEELEMSLVRSNRYYQQLKAHNERMAQKYGVDGHGAPNWGDPFVPTL